MEFKLDEFSGRLSYKLITSTVLPRPIGWVVTADAAGVVNAAPYSFFNAFSGSPAIVCLGMGRRNRHTPKDSLANIRARGEFVVNGVSEELAEAMNTTAVDFPAGWDELQTAGLATVPSTSVSVPHIAASPVGLECRLKQIIEVETTGYLVIAEVLVVHVRDDAVIDRAKAYIDSGKLRMLGRMQSPGVYCRTQDSFVLPQLDFAQWQAAHPEARPPGAPASGPGEAPT